MEKKSDIQKPASSIRKPSKKREPKVVTSDMRNNRKGDPESQRVDKPEKENKSHHSEQRVEQQSIAQQDNQSQQKPEPKKVVNEDEQKQVVNNSSNESSPTEAEDQK